MDNSNRVNDQLSYFVITEHMYTVGELQVRLEDRFKTLGVGGNKVSAGERNDDINNNNNSVEKKIILAKCKNVYDSLKGVNFGDNFELVCTDGVGEKNDGICESTDNTFTKNDGIIAPNPEPKDKFSGKTPVNTGVSAKQQNNPKWSGDEEKATGDEYQIALLSAKETGVDGSHVEEVPAAILDITGNAAPGKYEVKKTVAIPFDPAPFAYKRAFFDYKSAEIPNSVETWRRETPETPRPYPNFKHSTAVYVGHLNPKATQDSLNAIGHSLPEQLGFHFVALKWDQQFGFHYCFFNFTTADGAECAHDMLEQRRQDEMRKPEPERENFTLESVIGYGKSS